MSHHKITALLATLAVSLAGIAPAAADPCGMVPPPPPINAFTFAISSSMACMPTLEVPRVSLPDAGVRWGGAA